MTVIDPLKVEPTINQASAEHRDGRQVHRRILSRSAGGPASIDVGYNRSKAGLDYAQPYAYDRDEFCYTAAGVARMESDGNIVDFAAGMFMWRPAGAVTQRFSVVADYNSICAFGPARVDTWSHMLPQARFAAAGERPCVQFRSFAEVEPERSGAFGDGVEHRRIFTTPMMQVTHTVIPRGAVAYVSSSGRDEIYFLEQGSLSATVDGCSHRLPSGQFLIISAFQRCKGFAAETDCTLICWSARGPLPVPGSFDPFAGSTL